MEVRLFPNTTRPGVGLKPRREAQRPLLPQHARHCPVLEAGSALGFLVYPALEPHESFHVEYQGEGKYKFVYYVNPTGGKLEGVVQVNVALPVGGIGVFREEVKFLTKQPTTTKENALLMMRTFLVPEDLGSPAGGLSLRGAWNFQTPPGWDSVLHTGLQPRRKAGGADADHPRRDRLVPASRPNSATCSSRARGFPASHSLPIGQVFFVPREDVSMRECTADEITAIAQATEEFARGKAARQADERVRHAVQPALPAQEPRAAFVVSPRGPKVLSRSLWPCPRSSRAARCATSADAPPSPVRGRGERPRC